MGFRQHHTKEEKEDRVRRYHKLVDAGIPPKCALRYRDWTDNKIQMICDGLAVPTDLWLAKQENKKWKKRKSARNATRKIEQNSDKPQYIEEAANSSSKQCAAVVIIGSIPTLSVIEA